MGSIVVAFGAGLGLGLFLGGGSLGSLDAGPAVGGTASTALPGHEVQEREQENSLLSDRIRELNRELAEAKQNPSTILADRLAFYKKYQHQISIQPFDEDLKVTPEMSDLLGLSKEEKQAVEQHLAEIRAELGKMEDADTTLTNQTDNSVSYEITADAQGAALKEKLTGLVAGDIGDEKAELFMGAGQWSFNSQFSDFLKDKRQIEISWKQQGNPETYTTSETTSSGTSWSTTGAIQPQFQKYLPGNANP